MSVPAARDPWLDVLLDGVQLIEASAGTGKTFTLATLVTRLVVERGLRIGQVLAVTFTEAATQELRRRIRERLQLALRVLDAPPAGDDTPEAALTRQVLVAALARGGETRDTLRRRLRQAVLDTDLAAIFTIHGFCARALREHALDSGHGFDAPELLANDRPLREALAADLWRHHARDDAGAEDLAALWSAGHAALAEDLPRLLREPVLLPPAGDVDDAEADAAQARLAAAEAALREAWRAHGETFLDALAAAVDADRMNRGSYRTGWLAGLRAWLRAFAVDPARAGNVHPKLEKLTPAALASGTKKDHKARTPASPLCAAVAAYLDARVALDAGKARRRAALLHRLRDEARARMVLLKRQRRVQTYDDLIDGVAQALQGPNADALALGLRAQYAVALVDEFQDTDARQWAIFDRVFGRGSTDPVAGGPALFLIGDPKQAIYGFRGGDVHTYLAAADTAARAPALAQNFRSRPSVLAAIGALYAQAGDRAFVDERIRFRPVEAAGRFADADYLRDGQPAPALTLWHAPEPPADDRGRRKPWSAGASRDWAARACVAAIHRLLADARAGRAVLKDADTKALRAVQPGDIAVLVRSHREAMMVQQALALTGVPAVAAGKQSLFATAEARELHALLLALLHAGDDGRLRAALATVLLGVDAHGIAALDAPVGSDDGDAHRRWQEQAQRWRERWARAGTLALVGDLCAQHGERLLGLLDGERRLSNYLQLAEQLQDAQRHALGLHGLVDWLARRIAGADPDDETQLLRLESDARRVQIVTLHKSKGLEYPLVFLPFAGIGRNAPAPGRCCVVHSAGHGRRLHWKLDLPEADWKNATDDWKKEQRAEDARLLYVGLTRAAHALWIATGNFHAHETTPLAAMLAQAGALAAAGIVSDATPPPVGLPRLPPDADAAVPAPRVPARRLRNDWWVYSFSQLAKADAGDDPASAATLPAAGGHDEPETEEEARDAETFDARFAGTRFGVALHAALERADFAAWAGWRAGRAAPADEAAVIAAALRAQGYGADVLDDGIALATRLVGATLTAALPEGTRLCDVPVTERRPEIEFQFALRPVQVDALLQLLHAHGIVRERRGFGLRQQLEGLMNGVIDLAYRHAGRWYVLDYKSNRLPGYDPASLQRAMAHSEYDLQALIYTLALHRWLRFRLGQAYDYARDFGGFRYLFCRGLDAAPGDGAGIHAQRFAPDLVHALDALCGGEMPPCPQQPAEPAEVVS